MDSSSNPLRFMTPRGPCSYLPAETSSLEYRIQLGMDESEYSDLLQRGWRRHGVNFFRPACPHCTKCQSLRVDVADFRASRSQRRCRRRNADIEFVVRRASISSEHIRLYNLWHQDMTARRGWSLQQTTPDDYTSAFLIGEWAFAYEMLYFQEGRLLGVGLVDLLEEAVSSVYFYHDPEWRPQGPGTFSLLTEIEYARQTGRQHVYLGYAIHECPSMAYKFGFAPHEILAEYVPEETNPVWTRTE